MIATGLFFLSARPCIVHAKSPVDGDVIDWCFPVLERRGPRGTHKWLLFWRGTDAAKMVQLHANVLKAGCALQVDFDRIVAGNNCLEAHVLTCKLAPQRWPEPASTPPATTTATA